MGVFYSLFIATTRYSSVYSLYSFSPNLPRSLVIFSSFKLFLGEVPGGGTTPGQPGGTTPGGPTKPTDVGDKEKDKGGDKISKNQGVNPAGGNTNKDTENEGTNTGPIQPVNPSDGDDKDDHVHGGIQGKNQLISH